MNQFVAFLFTCFHHFIFGNWRIHILNGVRLRSYELLLRLCCLIMSGFLIFFMCKILYLQCCGPCTSTSKSTPTTWFSLVYSPFAWVLQLVLLVLTLKVFSPFILYLFPVIFNKRLANIFHGVHNRENCASGTYLNFGCCLLPDRLYFLGFKEGQRLQLPWTSLVLLPHYPRPYWIHSGLFTHPHFSSSIVYD